MIKRPFWQKRIEDAWKTAPIVWLAGVRRSGKTTLAQSLGKDRLEYLNCDLPVVEEMIKDPENFYRGLRKEIVVFDEVHQLQNPSQILKIGADHFPKLKILATGSSTLAASKKFKDTLTGRKQLVHLTPVLWDELEIFEKTSLHKRLYHGGLPPTLLSDSKNPAWYREWMDSFFARDIQRLFSVRDMNRFNTFLEYMLKQSGGLFEIARASSELGISRPTVENHLTALEVTQAITVLRPYHGGGQKELVKMPKIYGFDTGFVSFCRGWDPLRPSDNGPLWEHIVLEFLQAHKPFSALHYWRDQDGRELDFVIPETRKNVDVIECKWNPSEFEPSSLQTFRSYYPKGNNFLVSPQSASYTRSFGKLKVRICNPAGLLTKS
jgi:predicted AAA+ superfamily ATPase